MNAICTDRCETAALECIIGCENDVNCISGCLRDQAECSQGKSVRGGRPGSIKMYTGCTVQPLYFTASFILDGFSIMLYMAFDNVIYFSLKFLDCPCEIGCLDGCDDCSNPVCQCEVSFSINHTAWSLTVLMISF